ncbi:MAG TPA: GGDEF domain-containing protein [Steroidobacteraceae bacterium]|nr:GGDEF domain-containing protein [Steroidobacteraceae bacterium]
MELASIVQSSLSRSDAAAAAASAARSLEIAGQLRAAIMEGDDARVARLLSDLLRVTGLTKGQRVRLQSRALMNLVHSLRALALSDELTGLLNRRGFMQSATRLLDLALRDGQEVHLVYFRLDLPQPQPERRTTVDRGTALTRDLLLRRMGNFLRDLFPSYGVYEVLGRLGAADFAALTPTAENASRSSIALRARKPESGTEAPALPLRIAVAHFDPAKPTAVDELLQIACHELLQDAAREAALRLPVAPLAVAPLAVAPLAAAPLAAAPLAAAPLAAAPIASIGSPPRSDLTLA